MSCMSLICMACSNIHTAAVLHLRLVLQLNDAAIHCQHTPQPTMLMHHVKGMTCSWTVMSSKCNETGHWHASAIGFSSSHPMLRQQALHHLMGYGARSHLSSLDIQLLFVTSCNTLPNDPTASRHQQRCHQCCKQCVEDSS